MFYRDRTARSLLGHAELIINNLEEGNLVLGIFIDYSKAFDRLQHKTLTKLTAYGVCGVAHSLMCSYDVFLLNRRQCVVIGNISSDRAIGSGVPQGSILGPLLFDVYINDMIDTQNEATIILYADDTSLFVSGPVAGKVIHKVNALLFTLSEWSSSNGLKINNKKSKEILFRTRGRQVSLCDKLLIMYLLRLLANIRYLVSFSILY